MWYKSYLHKNEALNTPDFYMKMKYFNIVFHITRGKWKRFQSLSSGFFNGPFLRGYVSSQVQGPRPGLGLVFRQCRRTLAIIKSFLIPILKLYVNFNAIQSITLQKHPPPNPRGVLEESCFENIAKLIEKTLCRSFF